MGECVIVCIYACMGTIYRPSALGGQKSDPLELEPHMVVGGGNYNWVLNKNSQCL